MNGRWDEMRRGWATIVAAGAGACAGITGLGFYTFGLFVKPLSGAFGWSRGQVSLGLSCITLGTIICAPIVGRLIDRFGVRRVAGPSLIGLGLAFCGLSVINGHIISFYFACGALAVLGCATSPVSWTRAVSLTFHQHRGLALGLTLLGSASAGLIGVPLLQAVIGGHGWRAAYLCMAGFTVLVAFPVVFALLRGPEREARAATVHGVGMTLKAAVRTAPFWILGVATLVQITAQSGVLVHLVPMLTDRGLKPVAAAGLVGLMGLATFVSRAATGALLDRFSPALVAGLTLLAPAAAAAILAFCGGNTLLLTIAILLLGVSAGAEIDLLAFFTSRFFGVRFYGAIYGVLFAMFSMGNGLGAPLVGAAFDHWRSYTVALWIACALFALAAALFAALGRHRVRLDLHGSGDDDDDDDDDDIVKTP